MIIILIIKCIIKIVKVKYLVLNKNKKNNLYNDDIKQLYKRRKKLI